MKTREAPKNRRRLGLVELLAAIALACLLLYGRVLLGQLTVVRLVDAVLASALVIGTIESLIAWVVMGRRPDLRARVAATTIAEHIRAGMAVALFGLLLPATVVLTLNEKFDGSRATAQVLTVTEKWIRTYRDGSKACMASVVPDVQRALPFPAMFGDSSYILLPCGSWSDIIPGRSTLTLLMHPGFIGIPWYDSAVQVTP